MRGGEKKTLTAKVAKREEKESLVSREDERSDALGLQVADLTNERAQQFGLDKDESGVLVVDVENGSRAEKAGVRVGDIIKGINRQKVDSLDDYSGVMKKADSDEALHMLILRRNEGLKAIKIMP